MDQNERHTKYHVPLTHHEPSYIFTEHTCLKCSLPYITEIGGARIPTRERKITTCPRCNETISHSSNRLHIAFYFFDKELWEA